MASRQLLQSSTGVFEALSSRTTPLAQSALANGMLQFSTRTTQTPLTSSVLSSTAQPGPLGLTPLPAKANFRDGSAGSWGPSPAAQAAIGQVRQSSATASVTEEVTDKMPGSYDALIKWLHWTMAGLIISGMLLIQAARASKGDDKAYYMMLHKSFGLLIFGMILARTYSRLTTKVPGHLPGSSMEHFAATASHNLLYFFMWFMPASGIAMGYFGGKGLPFFGYTIPGKAEPVGEIAKWSFKTHKWAGQAFQYFLPAHVGAAFYHRFKGQYIFERVNPFATPRVA